MALKQKMKLQDLKMKVGALNSSRWELLKEQINAAALVIQTDALAYFTSKGFTITGQMPKVKATYNGGLEVSIDFSSLIGDFFGCDGCVEFKYEGRIFLLNYLVARGNAPALGTCCGSPEAVMQKEIEFYEEKLLPYLQNIGNSDLSGDVRLYSRENNASGRVTTIDYHSVNEAIDSFID